MNVKSAVKYQIWEFKRPIAIYYFIIYMVYIALTLLFNVFSDGMDGGVNGIDVATIIFLFVCGLNSFTDSFRMFLQNGLSRKTLFKSFLICTVAVVTFMVAADFVTRTLIGLLTNYSSLYSELYVPWYLGGAHSAMRIFEEFLWTMSVYGLASMMGFFLSTLYYNMGKAVKLLVSIGVPVSLFILLPMIDSTFTNGAIFTALGKFFGFILGFQNGANPYFSIVSFLIIAVVFGALSYLMVRKAVVKE